MARYAVMITNNGVPQTALTPTMSSPPGSNVAWRYQDGTGAPVEAVPTVSELDAVNAPGWYYFDTVPTKEIVATIDADPAGAVGLPSVERYVGTVVGPYDYAVPGAAWDALETAHTTAGSFGELMKVIAGLGFRHYKQYSHVFNGNGQLTSAVIRVYATKALLTADTPLITLNWSTTYSGTQPNVSSCTT